MNKADEEHGMARSEKRNPNKPHYRSKFEKSFGANLTKRGIKFEFEPYKITYYIAKKGHCKNCGSKEVAERHSYTPDFKIGEMLIETKGRLTSSNRTKMMAVKENNPRLDIRFIFMYDNFLTKAKTKRYSDWCEKEGFKYDFMKISKDWVAEAIGKRK